MLLIFINKFRIYKYEEKLIFKFYLLASNYNKARVNKAVVIIRIILEQFLDVILLITNICCGSESIGKYTYICQFVERYKKT